MQTKIRERVGTIKASAWSHLHIASGEKIERWDYFFDQGKLWLLDESKLAEIVGKDSRLIDEMTKAAADPSQSLNSFLNLHQDLKPQLRKVGREVPQLISNPESAKSKPVSRPSTNPFAALASLAAMSSATGDSSNPVIRPITLFAGSPNCYVPGSSIKGAMRTAVISELIDKGKLPLSRDVETLRRYLKASFSPNSSDNVFFRNLLVSDSLNLPEKDFGIASVETYARNDSRGGDRGRGQEQGSTDTFCELLLWDSEFEFEIKLRANALARPDISVNSIQELLEIVDRFYRKIWRKEKENRSDSRRNSNAIREFYASEPEDCYLMRLGFGSGQLATSILADYQEKFNRDMRDRTPYPITAKTAVASKGEEEQQMPLGWVKIAKSGVKEHAD